MKYKILLFFILTASCSAELNKQNARSSYFSSGFAYIYEENDFYNKIVTKKFDNSTFQISHDKLKTGTIVKVMNPENNKSINLKIKKKAKYPEFYQVLLTKAVLEKLELNKDIPFVEIQEIKKNKSFVASKAKTFNEEKNVPNKAPVTEVKINNILKTKESKKIKIKKFSIIIAKFYSKESAISLKNRLIKEMTSFNNKKISIKEKKKNSFELLSGPYNTVNSLKNDYIDLKKYGFEELEIKLNE
tara:strand:- start:3447 stop:4181 length:735 start_codon:yes stop_codon:yes gene_type:complete